MPQITAVTVEDVRFPTSLTADGSDAMNKDGDYSAAYVVLHTDGVDSVGVPLAGHGLTFTIGRGNDIVAAAAVHQAQLLVGLDVATMAADMGAVYRLLTSDSPTAVARAGEGRRPPVPGRRVERRLGPGRPARRQAAVATARRHVPRATRRHRRPALPVRRADPRRGTGHPAGQGGHAGPTASPSSTAPATPPTPPRPAGSATATTSCAGCARRRWTPATGTSSSRWAPTSTTTSAAARSPGRSSARTAT